MASNQIQQTGSFYLTGSFSASLGFDGTASYANKATRVDGTITSGDGIETFSYNGGGDTSVSVDTSSAHFLAPINAVTASLVDSASISGTTLTLHLGDGSTLANVIASASFAVTASHALNSANADTDVFNQVDLRVLNYGGTDRYEINGLQAPNLTLNRGETYRFDQSDATNAGQTFGLATIDGTAYTTGVTTVGTAGTAGAYTQVVVGYDTTVSLRYRSLTDGVAAGNFLTISDMFAMSATGSLQGTATNANTASLATRNIITASVALNTITFTKGDGTTFPISVAQSGSVATASFAETTEFDGILNKPTLVSGSSQISYTGITDIPYLVSQSAQIILEDTAFTDGSAFSVLRTDGAGTIAFDFADRAYFNVRAAENLAKGDPMYVSGYNIAQDRVLVSKADANDPAKMPVVGLAAEAITAASNGVGVIVGVLDTVDTSTFTIGDELYVANGGGLTATEPTGDDEIQTVGIVIRSDAANGRIAVAARMSSNAAATATVDTGSLVTTSSISGTTITFTKGDGTTYTNEIVSASYALTASHEVVHEVSSSYAETASFAESVEYDNILNKPTLLSSSAQIASDISGAFASDSASFSTRITDLEDFSSSLDATYATDADLTALSSSASDARNAIVAGISGSSDALSGSASDARNQLATDYIAADTALSSSASDARNAIVAGISGSSNALSGSASAARNQLAADYIAADTALSSSASDARNAIVAGISGSSDALSGSASDARNQLATDYAAADSTLSGSASDARNAIVSNISGAFSIPAGTVSSSAQTIANLPTGTVSGSAQVTGSTLITGSVQGNTLTFTKGDGSTFDLLVITSSGGGGSTDTGSLLTTASVSATTMSFTKGDASTFEVYVTDSVSASFASTASYVATASYAVSSSISQDAISSSYAISASHTQIAVSSSKVDKFSALTDLTEHADDDNAADAGVPIGGLYRNGNFVLIRIGGTGTDTHYLSGFSNTNFIDFNAGLSGFLSSGGPWSFGFRSVGLLPDSTDNLATFNRTGDGVVFFQHQSSTNWSLGTANTGGSSGSSGWGTPPTETSVAYWLFIHDGAGSLRAYYNAPGNVSGAVSFFSLPASPNGDITFGNSVSGAVEPWSVGASAFYFANTALPTSILTTAAANNGIISSDANYGDVDCFLTVNGTGVTDQKGNFGSAAINGTLTFTGK